MTDTTTLSPEQLQLLAQPLDMHLIRYRMGAGGKQLKYLKGDTAIDTANRIFGYGQWGYKVLARSHEIITDARKGQIELYTADIELYVVGAAYPFPGDGIGIVTEPFTVEMHEKARKEATTDALKRALRHLGDQFGLCLYDEDDYVDAGNGMLIPVKEVTPSLSRANKAGTLPRRIVEATQPSPVESNGVDTQQHPSMTVTSLPVERVRERLIAAFRTGKSQHLFSHKRGMAEYVSKVLGRTVLMDELTQLADEELSRVEKALLQQHGSEHQEQPEVQSA